MIGAAVAGGAVCGTVVGATVVGGVVGFGFAVVVVLARCRTVVVEALGAAFV